MLEIDEEYDVTVMTEAGDRPIAMMSGGEQDIVSLCIRIAIAKMILESTGAGEQAFVLDEMFALEDPMHHAYRRYQGHGGLHLCSREGRERR